MYNSYTHFIELYGSTAPKALYMYYHYTNTYIYPAVQAHIAHQAYHYNPKQVPFCHLGKVRQLR